MIDVAEGTATAQLLLLLLLLLSHFSTPFPPLRRRLGRPSCTAVSRRNANQRHVAVAQISG